MKKLTSLIFVLLVGLMLAAFDIGTVEASFHTNVTGPGDLTDRNVTGPGDLTDRNVTGPGNDVSGTSGDCDGSTPKLCNPLKVGSIEALFRAIIDVVMIFAIPIIVFFIVYAGFLYVTARGNVEQIQKAHNALLYALIGGLLIIGANVLIEVIGGTVESINQ